MIQKKLMQKWMLPCEHANSSIAFNFKTYLPCDSKSWSYHNVLICGMLLCSAAWKHAVIWVKSGKVSLCDSIWPFLHFSGMKCFEHTLCAQKNPKTFFCILQFVGFIVSAVLVCLVCNFFWKSGFFSKMSVKTCYLAFSLAQLKQLSVYSVMKLWSSKSTETDSHASLSVP